MAISILVVVCKGAFDWSEHSEVALVLQGHTKGERHTLFVRPVGGGGMRSTGENRILISAPSLLFPFNLRPMGEEGGSERGRVLLFLLVRLAGFKNSFV